MIALAVGLWPQPDAEFSPERASVFVLALSSWLYAELFTEQPVLSEHDRELAFKIYQVMPDNRIRFLQEHDFGSSWLNAQVLPVFDLADLAHNPMSEFADRRIQAAFVRLRTNVVDVANRLAMQGHAIGPAGFISMVPDLERAMDFFSPETHARVQEMNNRTSDLASEIVAFYRLLRKKGVNLLGNVPAA